MRKTLPWLMITTLLALPAAQAQQASIEEPSWMDRNQMTQQIESIDELARTRLGRQVRGDQSDIELIQRLLDRELIGPEETFRLQALGVVLGDVMVNEVDQLQWRAYEDAKGRNRAVCIRNTSECLFPTTMLSRRVSVGLEPDVRRIYDDAMELIKPHLPDNPWLD